jgi:beta-glucosidase
MMNDDVMNGRQQRVEQLISSMTLVEKAAQMTQVELHSISAEEVSSWSVGSVLSGGGGNPGDGSASAWRSHVEGLLDASRQSRLGVPILYGSDAVHGHSNVRGATIFPHNIGLGATHDVGLVERVSRASALETAATGVRWTFAPCLAVAQDVRWGRTYEAFGSEPGLVAELGAAAVTGWHGEDLPADGVLACAKHFVGEGSTVWGTAGSHRHRWIDWWNGWGDGWQIDQGDILLHESELRRLHFPPFVAVIEAGTRTIMASYASWQGRRLHEHRYLLTDVLKGELGFGGFVVSDWLAVDQVHDDHATAVERAIGAGIDMVMVPFDFQRFINTVVELVETGRLPLARIDDAVRRILSVKGELGLLDEPRAVSVPLDVVGCDAHRSLAREAAAASAVVLTNEGVLPIPPEATIHAAGAALDDVGISCGGWTISWEGGTGPITEGRTVLDGLRRVWGDGHVSHERDGHLPAVRADYGVVSIHELPYVEGGGDRGDLRLPEEQIEVVRRLRHRVDVLVVIVVSGRPLVIEPVVELADAVIACWLPGSEADGIADALAGTVPIDGRLPMPWPRHHDHVPDGARDDIAVAPWPIGQGGQRLARAGEG